MQVKNSHLIPSALILLLAMMIAGCWRQELIIALNADGSGEVFARRIRSADSDWEGDDRPAKEFSDYGEGEPVERIYYNRIERDANNRFVEEVSYSFEDLGEAIPILEHEFDFFPKFRYKDDRFVISLERERYSFLQYRENIFLSDMFCRVTLLLPAPPESEHGTVDGDSFVWTATNDDFQRFLETPIGTVLAEASIPADAIDTDIRPRSEMRRREKLARTGYVRGSIQCDGKPVESLNATSYFSMKFDDVALPSRSKDLRLTTMVVNEAEVSGELDVSSSGIYTGGIFRLAVKFDLYDPFTAVLNLVQAELTWVEPVQFAEHKMTIEDFPVGGGDCFAFVELPGRDGKFVAVTNIRCSEPLETHEAPAITLVTNADTDIIAKLCVNTDYGLRFERYAERWRSIGASELRKNERAYAALKDCRNMHRTEVNFARLPAEPFDVAVVTIEEFAERKQIIKLEDLYLGAIPE